MYWVRSTSRFNTGISRNTVPVQGIGERQISDAWFGLGISRRPFITPGESHDGASCGQCRDGREAAEIMVVALCWVESRTRCMFIKHGKTVVKVLINRSARVCEMLLGDRESWVSVSYIIRQSEATIRYSYQPRRNTRDIPFTLSIESVPRRADTIGYKL
jgi:hypothetical protein